MTDKLFEPLQVGDLSLSPRIVLAPLTRLRKSEARVPGELSRIYYEQRASVPSTLLISEGTIVAPQAASWPGEAGIYNDEQIKGWMSVVEAVHAKGSHIFIQIFAHGRAASAENLQKVVGPAGRVKSASDVPFEGGSVPAPLTLSEIDDYVEAFGKAAENAVFEAGADGVEIHFANGYLLEQFLDSRSNIRTDQYGGSVEKRARFPLEVLDRVVRAVGQKKVGFRVSPFSTFQGMRMPDEELYSTFTYFVKTVRERYPELAYMHAIEPRIAGADDQEQDEQESLDFLHKLWSPRPVILSGGFDCKKAATELSIYPNALIGFGRHFIANPDLVHRIKYRLGINEYDRSTFYGGNEQGYTDYPFANTAQNFIEVGA